MNSSARIDCTIVSAQRKLATAEAQVTGLRMAALEQEQDDQKVFTVRFTVKNHSLGGD
jgi:hypothetical protein